MESIVWSLCIFVLGIYIGGRIIVRIYKKNDTHNEPTESKHCKPFEGFLIGTTITEEHHEWR